MSRRFNISAPLLVSATSLVMIALVVVAYGPAIVRAALGPSSGLADPQATLTGLVEEHERDFETYTDRFNGRSFFFKPPPWPQPRPVRRPVEPQPERPVVAAPPPEDPGPAAPPPPPPTYTGPRVVYALGDSVWFESDRNGVKSFEIAVGQEQEGIRVIETSLPWSVKLAYRGGQYDVGIFERTDPFASNEPPPPVSMPGLVDASASTSTDEANDDEAGLDDEELAENEADDVEEDAATDVAAATGGEDGTASDDADVEMEEKDETGLAAAPADADETTADGRSAAPVIGDTPGAVERPPTNEAPPAVADAAMPEIFGPPEPPGFRPSSPDATAATEGKPRASDAATSDEVASAKGEPEDTPATALVPAKREIESQPGRPKSEPAPRRQPGGRPAPEQRPSRPDDSGAPERPDRTGWSDTSDAGSKKQQELTNADPGKE